MVVSSIKALSPQRLAFDGQEPALVIGQQETFLSLRFHQGVELGLIELDDLLLLAMDPTRENHQQELPGLQDVGHEDAEGDRELLS